VVVFSDFQCPACAIAAPILTRLADDGSISLTFRYFPLTSIHANANAAAGVAQAAALQDRFWQFHDTLFSQQATWAELPGAEADAVFEQIASEIGLDVARWRSDTTSPAVTDVVTADAREAQDLQLSGTPTIFIDGRQYDGGLSLSALQQAVAAAGLD
jgi:protein-disulfide isomerase